MTQFLPWKRSLLEPFTRRRWWVWPLRISAAIFVAGIVAFLSVYIHYAKLIEEKVGDGSVRTNSMVYAAPETLAVGDQASAQELRAYLQRSGYTDLTTPKEFTSKTGSYRLAGDTLEISTGPSSYFQPHTARITFAKGKIARIYSDTNKATTSEYAIEPELITNVFDGSREKRRLVQFSDLPKHLVNALVSVEDKRFFQHGGLDIIRVAKAAYVDIREGRKEQGASTITMQLARSFFLDQDKTWKRKMAEVLITAELERRFSKQQILEFYANEVYLGRRGSFSIQGFGEAARAYFGKDIRQLTVAESAMLAGIIQRPGHYNPFKYPERVKSRRDLVLTLMFNNGYLDAQQLSAATAERTVLSPSETESSDAPYFVDLVNDELLQKFQDWDFASNSFRVYTTLDMKLQRAAAEAVQAGMKEVDTNLRKKYGKKAVNLPKPQVALVALDSQTGALKALVGGRSYNQSQLNHVLARRQPGSSFKPFVYAAALSTALQRKENIITMATRIEDVPTTFWFNNQRYEPGNFHDAFHGSVTLRQALTHSMNIPAVKIAEKAGYENVAKLAHDAGLGETIQATPSLALGSYEVTPLDIADAYTIFTNKGKYEGRYWINNIRDRKNAIVYSHTPRSRQVLDPRIAYMMVNMMEDVIRSGTAAGVRSRGFALPAAGKTGTSRDGWFAGFTSELLCIVWIGFDDYRELGLEGSKSALPVWTEFMKTAHKFREYSDAKPFEQPQGLTRVGLCDETGHAASEYCAVGRSELFINGTQPRRCTLHTEDGFFLSEDQQDKSKRNVFGRIFGVFR